MAFEINQIAAGHDNQDELTRWHKLGTTACPLFPGYKRYIETEWHCSESEEIGGDRLYIKIGRPWFAYIMPFITEEEHNFLIENFTTTGLSGHVTVTAYDRDTLVWKDFNATMHLLPDNTKYDLEKGFYADYRIEFRDLEEL